MLKSKSSISNVEASALFAWLISRTFLANEQYFSLTTNQPTVLSAMAYQPSEQSNDRFCVIVSMFNFDSLRDACVH